MPIQTYHRRDEIGGSVRWAVSTELAERMQELSAQIVVLFAKLPTGLFFSKLAQTASAKKLGRRSFPYRDGLKIFYMRR